MFGTNHSDKIVPCHPGVTDILGQFVRSLKELRQLARLIDAETIARRMFYTNSIDGLISALGVFLGMTIAGTKTPIIYLGAVLGGSFSMGVFSAFFGTYLSERAERLRELKVLEKKMLAELDDTIYGRAARAVPLYVAFWSSLGVLLFPALAMFPMALVVFGVIDIGIARYLCLLIVHILMFSLGAGLGKISGENWVKSGARSMGIAFAATLLYLVIGKLGIIVS